MKLKQQDMYKIPVPSSFTKGATGEDKEALEEMYRNSVSVLRRIRSFLQQELNELVYSSESIDPKDHMRYVRNSSARHELRRIIDVYFPDDIYIGQ
jgi:hypothetical protein